MEPWTPGPWTVEDGWVAGPSWVFDWNNNVGIENEADARLIALAPEMAELLADIAATYSPESGAGSWVGRAHELLARARGDNVPAPASPS